MEGGGRGEGMKDCRIILKGRYRTDLVGVVQFRTQYQVVGVTVHCVLPRYIVDRIHKMSVQIEFF